MLKKEFTITISRKKAFLLAALIVLTLIRLVLSLRLPIFVMGDQDYDDVHLITMTLNMLKGEWLGEYSLLTLSKNLSYSFLLAFCYITMVPYCLLLGLYWVFSSYIFCRALRPAVSVKARRIFYLLLLYSPVGFTTLISQRIYRNAILPSAVLCVFAGYIALFLRKGESWRKWMPWGIFLGISCTFFWFIKEDSIWIVPFSIVISALLLIWMILHDRRWKSIVAKAVMLFIPFLSIMVVSIAVSTVNYVHYGVFATNDRSGTAFAEMASDLFAIEDDSAHDDSVWVTRDMLDKAYEVSPTFATLKDKVNEQTSWTDENNELPGDYIIWQIRWAMYSQGYYDSGSKANDFAKQVSTELEAAYQDGRLQRDGKLHITAQMKGMEIRDILSYIPQTMDALWQIASYRDCGIDETCISTGKDISIRRVESFLAASTEYGITVTDEATGEILADPAIKHHSYPKFIANTIVSIYRMLSLPVMVLALISFAFYCVLMIVDTSKGKFEKWNFFWILSGILLSAFLVELEVQLFTSFFEEAMHEKFMAFYSASVFPLLAAFKYLGVYVGAKEVVSLVKAHFFVI